MIQDRAGKEMLQIPKAEVVYVSFAAEINPQTTESLISVMAKLANDRVKTVYLLFSTPGGSVMHGMVLFNILRGMPFELIAHNIGNVDSIGTPIFLAAKKRYACKHSTFMFHGVGFNVPEKARIEEKILRERLDSLIADQTRIAGIITDLTKITSEQVREFFREGKTLDAATAVGLGIVDEIRDVQLPDGGPIISLIFQRQSV